MRNNTQFAKKKRNFELSRLSKKKKKKPQRERFQSLVSHRDCELVEVDRT